MPGMLEAQICDVWGWPLAGATIVHTHEGGGLQVDIPLKDLCLAQLTMSAYDPAAKYAKVLGTILSVTYGAYLIFKGPILQVKKSYANGTVQISAHDATLRL